MKKTVKIALIAFVLVIAINITAITLGFESKSPTPTTTPRPSVVATSTPTIEPTVIATPDQTPTKTTVPSATPESTQTGTPAPTTTSQPTVTATPTATAAPTSQPTATPAQPTPTQTSAPTATQSGGSEGSSPMPTPTPAPTSSPNPTQTTAPTSTQTPTTTVSISTVAQVKKGNTFTIDININNVAYMAYACFDLQFNSNYISYISCSPSQIGSGTGDAMANIMQPGLLRVMVDYSSYAAANGGNGVTGSGYLCKLTFTATAQGTSQLDFVKEQGAPLGELTLLKWVAYIESEIENVGWTNSSIKVN